MSYTVPATHENSGYAGLRHCLLGSFAVSYIDYVHISTFNMCLI
jgi:hypothetical protein